MVFFSGDTSLDNLEHIHHNATHHNDSMEGVSTKAFNTLQKRFNQIFDNFNPNLNPIKSKLNKISNLLIPIQIQFNPNSTKYRIS